MDSGGLKPDNLKTLRQTAIKSGDFFVSGRTGGVIGAIVPWRGAYAGVAPAHIFHYSGTDSLRADNRDFRIAFIPGDADLAFFPIKAACEPTDLSKPHLGEVSLKNAARKRICRISDVSRSIAYVVLAPGDLPGPGDSGTPLIQDGKVVGMLLSFNMHTCKGLAISAEMIKEAARKRS